MNSFLLAAASCLWCAHFALGAAEPVSLEIEHSLVSNAGGKRAFTSRGILFYQDPRSVVQDGTKKSPMRTSKARLSGADLKAFQVPRGHRPKSPSICLTRVRPDAPQKLIDEDGNYLLRVKNPSGSVVTAYARAVPSAKTLCLDSPLPLLVADRN